MNKLPMAWFLIGDSTGLQGDPS